MIGACTGAAGVSTRGLSAVIAADAATTGRSIAAAGLSLSLIAAIGALAGATGAAGLYDGRSSATASDALPVGSFAYAGAAVIAAFAGLAAWFSRAASSSSKSFDAPTFGADSAEPPSPAPPLRRRRPPRRPRRRERNSSRADSFAAEGSCPLTIGVLTTGSAVRPAAAGEFELGGGGVVIGTGAFASAGARCGCGAGVRGVTAGCSPVSVRGRSGRSSRRALRPDDFWP